MSYIIESSRGTTAYGRLFLPFLFEGANKPFNGQGEKFKSSFIFPVVFSAAHLEKEIGGREHVERKTPFSGVRNIGLTPERLIKTRVRPRRSCEMRYGVIMTVRAIMHSVSVGRTY